jgi:tRNA U34 5-methylaminomethyl-2-thiouridine-forming methyltransferase MnmC
MHQWPSNIEIFTTQDGSSTLIFRNEQGYCEKMHHSGGALSESLYIYHEALQLALANNPSQPPRVLSVGLGLGYNELIAIAEFERRSLSDWRLWSFERLDFLRDSFVSWLRGSPSPLSELYEQILAGIAVHLQVPAIQVYQSAQMAESDGRLSLEGAFPAAAGPVNCVFYDAYSKKMDPELWIEQGLIEGLRPALNNNCVFATYAATGALNRALKVLGFQQLEKSGFQGKRESTLAVR